MKNTKGTTKAQVTITETVRQDDGRITCAGVFPDGLVRGVKAFEFSFSGRYFDLRDVTINGVGYYCGFWFDFFGGDVDDWELSKSTHLKTYSYGDPSQAARRSALAVARLLIEAVRSSDAGCSVVACSVLADNDKQRQDTIDEIAELEAKIEELRAKLSDMPEAGSVALSASGLALASNLVGSGLSEVKAVMAAAAVA